MKPITELGIGIVITWSTPLLLIANKFVAFPLAVWIALSTLFAVGIVFSFHGMYRDACQNPSE